MAPVEAVPSRAMLPVPVPVPVRARGLAWWRRRLGGPPMTGIRTWCIRRCRPSSPGGTRCDTTRSSLCRWTSQWMSARTYRAGPGRRGPTGSMGMPPRSVPCDLPAQSRWAPAPPAARRVGIPGSLSADWTIPQSCDTGGAAATTHRESSGTTNALRQWRMTHTRSCLRRLSARHGPAPREATRWQR